MKKLVVLALVLAALAFSAPVLADGPIYPPGIYEAFASPIISWLENVGSPSGTFEIGGVAAQCEGPIYPPGIF